MSVWLSCGSFDPWEAGAATLDWLELCFLAALSVFSLFDLLNKIHGTRGNNIILN